MAERDEAAKLTRQMSLDLRPRTHGGARAGAGRPRKKDSERGFIAHGKRPSHRKGDPVHVTLRVHRRVPSLRRQVLAQLVKGALVAQRKALAAKGAQYFQLVHFSIQDDHIHLIVEAADKRGLWRGMTGLEVRITRAINKELGRKGRLWAADRYHRRDLRTPTETRTVLRYVLMNAQKHHRISGERALADAHSSAATFDGFGRPPRIRDNEVPWPPVVPRTWLLATGWRRRGLIDPAWRPLLRS